MKNPVIIVGIGEIGGVLARGFLRAGHPVYPVLRGQNASTEQLKNPVPALALIAVGESDLAPVLADLPMPWRDRVGLLQNELLPRDWQGIEAPTVVSIWFEKKPGQDVKVLVPSPIHGPRAELLASAFEAVGIPYRLVADSAEMEAELVVKNCYILTTNIAGLRCGGTVGELWADHRELARSVLADVIELQQALTGRTFDHDRLLNGMLAAFDGDPEHRCMGRSAPQRLTRALKTAEELGVEVPTLRAIAAESIAS